MALKASWNTFLLQPDNVDNVIEMAILFAKESKKNETGSIELTEKQFFHMNNELKKTNNAVVRNVLEKMLKASVVEKQKEEKKEETPDWADKFIRAFARVQGVGICGAIEFSKLALQLHEKVEACRASEIEMEMYTLFDSQGIYMKKNAKKRARNNNNADFIRCLIGRVVTLNNGMTVKFKDVQESKNDIKQRYLHLIE